MADGGGPVAEVAQGQGQDLVNAIKNLQEGGTPGTSIGAATQKSAEAKPAAGKPETKPQTTAADTQALKDAGAIDPAFQAQLETLKRTNVDAMKPNEVRLLLGKLASQGGNELLTSLITQSRKAQENYHPQSQEGKELKQKELSWTDMLNHLKTADTKMHEEFKALENGKPEEQAIALEIQNAFDRSAYSELLEEQNNHTKDFIEKKKKEKPDISADEIKKLLATDSKYMDQQQKISTFKVTLSEQNAKIDKLGFPRKLDPLAEKMAEIVHGMRKDAGPFTEDLKQEAKANPLGVMKECMDKTIGNPEAAKHVVKALAEAGFPITNEKDLIKSLTADKKNRLPGRIFKGMSLFALLLFLLMGRGYTEANASGGGRG